MTTPTCPACGATNWLVDCQVDVRVGVAITDNGAEVLVDRCGPEDTLGTVGEWVCNSCGWDITADEANSNDVLASILATAPWRVITDYREM